MTRDEVLDVFRRSGALLEGHFILRSGLRSRQFFQCALALQNMPTVERLGAALADQVRSLAAVTVIAPAMGGLVIGQEVARQLRVRFIFAEKENDKLQMLQQVKQLLLSTLLNGETRVKVDEDSPIPEATP